MRVMRWITRLVLVVNLVVLAGCGGQEESSDSAADALTSSSAPVPAAGSEANTAGTSGGTGRAMVQTVAAVPRKIIYTADVTLVAETLASAQQKLTRLVQTHKGYVAETEIDGSSGAPRRGRWKVRIPVDRYNAFMAEVAKIGEVQTIRSDSQDVSAEYYDLEARLANKRVEEKRLVKHLEQSTARLRDILEVEREISRVRGEIEQMQGRLRVLSNQTELTTVTVNINEVKDYVPPVPTTFAARVSRTFSESLQVLRDVLVGLALFIIALVPWLVIAALIGLPLKRFLKRRKVVAKTPKPQP